MLVEFLLNIANSKTVLSFPSSAGSDCWSLLQEIFLGGGGLVLFGFIWMHYIEVNKTSPKVFVMVVVVVYQTGIIT